MRPAALLLPAVLVIAAACSTIAPSATPSAEPSSSSPSPTAPASDAPQATPQPTQQPTTPPASPVVTPSPTDVPAPSMTPDEESLLRALRLDAANDCVPRRADLPAGSLYGIECRPDDPLVARVGIYWFPSVNEAAYAYMTRMASYGVDVNAGDCGREIPGDAPWTSGDHEGSDEDPGVFNWENSVLSPNRSGCFHDENGSANVRATCGNVYVGILGSGTDLSDLHDWAWRYPEGYEPGMPDAPGLCIGEGVAARGLPAVP